MKNFLRLIPMIAAAAVLSCTGPREPQSPSDALISRLAKQIEDGKIMFGHQDTYLYGHSWMLLIFQEQTSRMRQEYILRSTVWTSEVSNSILL